MNRNKLKSEIEWEKDIGIPSDVRCGNCGMTDKVFMITKSQLENLLAQSRQQFGEEIEEDLITRLAELRFAGLEDMIDSLSAEIKELIQAKLIK